MVKLDLGCGDNKRDGFTGVDKYQTPSVDIVHDLLTYPWPFESESVDEIFSSHFLEHIPGRDRPSFLDEIFRVLKPKAQVTFIVPYGKSVRSIQDYTHQWPPLVEESFLYFNKGWREANKLTHGLYDLRSDFDFSFAYLLNGNWGMRSEEARGFATHHYWNAINDLQVILTKRA